MNENIQCDCTVRCSNGAAYYCPVHSVFLCKACTVCHKRGVDSPTTTARPTSCWDELLLLPANDKSSLSLANLPYPEDF